MKQQLINHALRNYTQLSVLFTVHTNAIVVAIRISIGDLTEEVGRQQRRVPQAANTLAPPLLSRPKCSGKRWGS